MGPHRPPPPHQWASFPPFPPLHHPLWETHRLKALLHQRRSTGTGAAEGADVPLLLPDHSQSLLPSDAPHNELFPTQRLPSSLPVPNPGRCCVQDGEPTYRFLGRTLSTSPASVSQRTVPGGRGEGTPQSDFLGCTAWRKPAGAKNLVAQEAGKGEKEG